MTQYGRRHVTEIRGGTVVGPSLSGSLWAGGLDYQLALSNGSLEIEQLNLIQTGDGTNILMRSCGASPSENGEVRLVLDFEAPSAGSYAWLNQGTYVGIREFDPAKGNSRCASSSSMSGNRRRIRCEPRNPPTNLLRTGSARLPAPNEETSSIPPA